MSAILCANLLRNTPMAPYIAMNVAAMIPTTRIATDGTLQSDSMVTQRIRRIKGNVQFLVQEECASFGRIAFAKSHQEVRLNAVGQVLAIEPDAHTVGNLKDAAGVGQSSWRASVRVTASGTGSWRSNDDCGMVVLQLRSKMFRGRCAASIDHHEQWTTPHAFPIGVLKRTEYEGCPWFSTQGPWIRR